MTKNAKRREQFRKLGFAISSLGQKDWERERDWAIRRSEFAYPIEFRAVADRELMSLSGGPSMRTQQFEPTLEQTDFRWKHRPGA